MLDVMMAFRYVVGKQVLEPWQMTAGDVAPIARIETSPGWEIQGDGRITMEDVLVLLKASAGQL